MNSSTSSSNRFAGRRFFVRAALTLLVLVVLLELYTRWFVAARSEDYAQFREYPRLAAELTAQSGLRVAFLGNSATQEGLNSTLFETTLHNPSRQPVHAERFLADASEIHTWYYMTKRSFWEPGKNPDWLVVTFFRNGLEDIQEVDLGRLARAFTSSADWDEVFALDLPTLSSRTEYLMSSGWATYAVRDRYRKRVLTALVPNYMSYVHESNAVQLRRQKGDSAAPTYQALDRFLEKARKHEMKVCFVAFPLRRVEGESCYPLVPQAEQRIRVAGMEFLDLRRTPGLLPEHYRDEIHLVRPGAEIYTRHFARVFGELLASRDADLVSPCVGNTGDEQ
jgi:hypothetical protein